MRRTFILIFLVLISLLNASFLIDVYYKDYGVINRTVLVFDTKPQYDILKHESDIQINLQKCRKDVSLQKLDLTNSNVVTDYDYQISKDKVMVTININTSQLLVTGEIYKVEGMEIQGDVFKLVLDIFISTNPQTLSELASYAAFYKTTGNDKLADEYQQQVLALNTKIKEQQKSTTTHSTQTVTTKGQAGIINKLKSYIQEFRTKLNMKIIAYAVCAIILLAFVIFLIIKFSHKRGSAFDVDGNSLRPTDGFAENTFLEKAARDLAAKNWGMEEIAKELELPFEEVQKIIAPDLEQELERL